MFFAPLVLFFLPFRSEEYGFHNHISKVFIRPFVTHSIILRRFFKVGGDGLFQIYLRLLLLFYNNDWFCFSFHKLFKYF